MRLLYVTLSGISAFALPVACGAEPSIAASMEILDTPDIALAQQIPVDADFFVCSSQINGMDGHYVLSEEFTSDGTPVFVRDDDEGQSNEKQENSDFRLFRHHGFWMFANFASWPPETHFRCDPTQKSMKGMDFLQLCGVGYRYPPVAGYSRVKPLNTLPAIETYDIQQQENSFLFLHQNACDAATVSHFEL